MERVKFALLNIVVALNGLVCAVLFGFWSFPRETISGFIGRKALTTQFKFGRDVWIFFAKGIDLLVRDRGHCGETSFAEAEAYAHLYPKQWILKGECQTLQQVQAGVMPGPSSMAEAIRMGFSTDITPPPEDDGPTPRSN